MLAAAAAEPAHFEVGAIEIEVGGVTFVAQDGDRLPHEAGMAAGHDASPVVMISGARSFGQIGGPAASSHLRVTRAR